MLAEVGAVVLGIMEAEVEEYQLIQVPAEAEEGLPIRLAQARAPFLELIRMPGIIPIRTIPAVPAREGQEDLLLLTDLLAMTDGL